jgi:hypothetical protein
MILQRNKLNQGVIMVFSLPNCSSVLIGFENKSRGCLAGASSAIAFLKIHSQLSNIEQRGRDLISCAGLVDDSESDRGVEAECARIGKAPGE